LTEKGFDQGLALSADLRKWQNSKQYQFIGGGQRVPREDRSLTETRHSIASPK
jgi:hypothetical protein